jgi:hypothetical protein
MLAIIIALSVGCASQNAAISNSIESRQIVDIVIDDNPDALILGIQGNQELAHKEDRQSDPEKIVFFFPDTSLAGFKGRFFPPDNEFIRTILTRESVENETTNSIIYITLKSVSPYTVTSDLEKLLVTFPKNSTLPNNTAPQQKPAEKKVAPQPAKLSRKNEPVATALKIVTTETLENASTVNVKANGVIKKYKAFTLVNPDRIVFDIYNIKSPHHKEQRIAVQSKWIKRIRYYGHPHKLRLVIEALSISDSKYSAVLTDSGLLISVGAK